MSEVTRSTAPQDNEGWRRLWSRLIQLTNQVMGDPGHRTEIGYSVRPQRWHSTTREMTLTEVENALELIGEEDIERAGASLRKHR